MFPQCKALFYMWGFDYTDRSCPLGSVNRIRNVAGSRWCNLVCENWVLFWTQRFRQSNGVVLFTDLEAPSHWRIGSGTGMHWPQLTLLGQRPDKSSPNRWGTGAKCRGEGESTLLFANVLKYVTVLFQSLAILLETCSFFFLKHVPPWVISAFVCLFVYLILMFHLVFGLHVCLCDGVGSNFTDSCEPLCGRWELNPGSLKEQPMLLNSEPPPSPVLLETYSKYCLSSIFEHNIWCIKI